MTRTGVTPLTLSAVFLYRDGQVGSLVSISNSVVTTDTFVYDQNGLPLELLHHLAGGATVCYWYVLDGHATVVALTDSAGNVVDSYSYDAWGKPLSVSETVGQPYRYASYWYDQELGWYWVQVRHYSPSLERWLQPDPSRQDGTLSYVYVGDDPIDKTDPTGLDGICPSVSGGLSDQCNDAAFVSFLVEGAGALVAGSSAALIGGFGAVGQAGRYLGSQIGPSSGIEKPAYRNGPLPVAAPTPIALPGPLATPTPLAASHAQGLGRPTVLHAKKSDIRQIEAVAREFGMDEETRREFGDYLEGLKYDVGKGGSINYSYQELRRLAREFLGLEQGEQD